MIDTLRRLLSPEYLAVSQPGPVGGAWALYLLLAVVFGGGLAGAVAVLLRARGQPAAGGLRAWGWIELWLSLAGLVAVAGRLAGWALLSARAWPLALGGFVVAGAVALALRAWPMPAWLAAQFRVLALRPAADELPEAPAGGPSAARLDRAGTMWFAAGAIVHLLGTGLVLRARYGLPVWLAPVALAILLLPQAPKVAQRRLPRLMPLTPLLGVYAVTLLWLLYQGLDITVVGWQGLAFPNPFLSLFYLDGVVAAGTAYAFLCNLGIMSNEPGGGRRVAVWRWAATGLLAATAMWAGIVYLGKRTHGATASDPYAYAQMAVDLAERGTFVHRYPLFQEVLPLGIPWAPVLPVGYHLPRNALGDSPSVWATGASVLLAGGYKLLGEAGLYVTTPLVALLGLLATGALVGEALHRETRAVRMLTAALAVALLASSPEFVDRILVPMADAAALLFTVLALYLALAGLRRVEAGGQRTRDLLLYLAAGLSFGAAYWVRHTQLVLALPLALVLWWTYREAGARAAMRCGLFLAGGALLAAAPDIAYRWQVFGDPLATETTELPAMQVGYVGAVAGQLARDALAAGEWGYLLPLGLYGAYRLVRDHRRAGIMLGVAMATLLGVHLTYRFLRLRDLISLFPLVDLAVAYGATRLVHDLGSRILRGGGRERLGRVALPAVATGWAILSLGLSRWAMVDDLWQPGWASFGYVDAGQRAAFGELASVTPAGSVIGASLNAGAVAMYTGRDAVRPYDGWSAGDWDRFVAAMRAAGRSLYLLDDGELMNSFVAEQAPTYDLTLVADLDLPLFGGGGRETARLYHVEALP